MEIRPEDLEYHPNLADMLRQEMLDAQRLVDEFKAKYGLEPVERTGD